MMSVLFPEVRLPDGLVLGQPIVMPRDWIANSKAVAAQPFATPKSHSVYHASGLWRGISPIFSVQYSIDGALEIDLEASGAIMFPWALKEGIELSGCIVWLTDVPKGPYVRHVRVYATREDAKRDNERLSTELAFLG